MRGRRQIRLCSAAACVFLCCLTHASAQPPPASPSQPTVRSAAAAVAAGDLKRADSELQSLLQSTPNDVHAWNLLGIVRAQERREPEAEQLFKRALEIDSSFAGAHASLGLLYVQMGKSDLAIPQLQEALRLDPGRKDALAALASLWRDQAHAAAQSGDLEKALALLLEARKLDPNEPDTEYDLGMIALRMSLFPDAAEAFERSLKLRKDDVQALYGLGRATMALAKFDDARQAFARYTELRPQDASGHYALGVTLQALQRMPEARTEYGKSIELLPRQTESYLQLGLLDLDAGGLDLAAEQFDRVLKRAPDHAGALTGMGRVRFQKKEYSEAAALFERAIAADSKLREPHYYLGLTDARLGRKADSEKELQAASRIEHEEVEKHQYVLKVIDPEQVHVPESPQSQ